MTDLTAAFALAVEMILGFDPDLAEIVGLSLRVSLSAVGLAALIGLPVGAAVALFRFPGRLAVAALLNAFMGLPPVVVGLVVYLFLSRAGPLGVLGLLFTPTAMIVAQCLLIAPIIAALSAQTIADLHEEYDEQLRSLAAGPTQRLRTLLWDGRFRLLTAILAGFGRAVAEVGAVMIVGGNINHATRMMTTTIALETSKGNLALALALGVILIALALGISLAAMAARDLARARYG
jgi:tungstate transport system permease protein